MSYISMLKDDNSLSHILPFQGFWFEIIFNNKEIERYLKQKLNLKYMKKYVKKHTGREREKVFKIYILDKKLDLKNFKFVKSSYIYDDKTRISLFTMRNGQNFYFYYSIQNVGDLFIQRDRRIYLYIKDFNSLFFLLGTSFLSCIQLHIQHGAIMHGGMFKYRKKNFVILGNNGSGKTSLLLNLCRQILGIRFLGDDMVLIVKKGNNIYARPVMNGNIDELNGEMKKLAKKLGYDNYFWDVKELYKVDKLLFLKLDPSCEYTLIRKLKYGYAFKELIHKMFFPSLVMKGRMHNKLDIFTLLLRKCTPYQIRLGVDLRYPSPYYKMFFYNLSKL